ncbi:GNAT family N-acetyltransferase [Marinomonas algicola]|uniref:GNAT family N-acetyltransferase n=1 Tax=Marinomonas algicola TaxID=2773454 RepID=UPI00174EC859|nr:GNAT family N-acetyltransferase [Marinomonas algicola]
MLWIDIVGYVASFLIAVSLMMSSIVRLRWISLAGSLTFSIYGTLIGAYPVAVVNAFIVFINVYFLVKIHRSQVIFNVIKSGVESGQSGYIAYFLDCFSEDIQTFYPDFKRRLVSDNREYYLLTEQEKVVGIISGIHHSDKHFEIDLDIVTPTYRDYKLGHYLFDSSNVFSKKFGFSSITANVQTEEYQSYLEKVGFTQKTASIWEYQAPANL